MALVLKDRVKVTTTTTGTGAFAIGGAQFGFQGFSAFANGDTTYYTVVDHATGAWETGLGTYSSTGPTLARTTVLDSSNAGGLVNFGGGPKDMFVSYPAGKAVSTEGNVTLTGPLSVPAGASGAQVPQAQEIAGLVRAMAVGTVSQSGGVPTGAIIERGSNANGEYIRFADGTQICTTTLTMGASVSPVGGIYISGDVRWTFPAVFAATPYVNGWVNAAGFWVASGASTGPSSSDVRIALPATYAAGYLVRATAIGRWF